MGVFVHNFNNFEQKVLIFGVRSWDYKVPVETWFCSFKISKKISTREDLTNFFPLLVFLQEKILSIFPSPVLASTFLSSLFSTLSSGRETFKVEDN